MKIHINQAVIEDGDNAPESPEQAGWFDIED